MDRDITFYLFIAAYMIGVILAIWYTLLPWFILRVTKKMLKAQQETNDIMRQLLVRGSHLSAPIAARPTAPPIHRPHP